MFTGKVDAARLHGSVLSVPPLARRADLHLARTANAAMLAYMRAGGVTTFLYGGNANLYNVGVKEFAALLDLVEDIAAKDDWIIPSIGADFGKACDQAELLKGRAFPTAMLLPLRFPMTPAGLAKGVAQLAKRMGKPLLLYVKDEGFTTPADIERLLRDGAICAVKYAIPRKNPREDAFLTDLIARIGNDLIISGIGERPIVDHACAFGLKIFTSGSVCIAPRLSDDIRKAIQVGDFVKAEKIRKIFLPLEDLRDKYSPLRVLHDAVALAGIAATGPMLPFLSNIEDKDARAAIAKAAKNLRVANDRPRAIAAE